MGHHSAFWLRESGRMFLLYLAVGAAFVPSGLVYALFALAGWNHWLVAVLLLGAGFLTAHFVWGSLERRLLVRQQSEFDEPLINKIQVRREWLVFNAVHGANCISDGFCDCELKALIGRP